MSREMGRGRWPGEVGTGKATRPCSLALASEASETDSPWFGLQGTDQGLAPPFGPDMLGAELETNFREGKKLSRNPLAWQH